MSGLRTEKLDVGYNKKIVVSGVEITVNGGEILTLIGPNGAGKSTVLKTIATQLKAIGGKVYFGENDSREYTPKELALKMSVMFTGRQDTELLTCYDVASLGRYPYTNRLGMLTEADRKAVNDALEMTGMSDMAECDFSCMSDGQKQRALLARAICQEPEILILDEPVTFLDIKHKLAFMNILRSLAKERNIAVVMSLHELDLAQKISDRAVCIKDGKAVFSGTPEEAFEGGRISWLYDVDEVSFNSFYGTTELEKPNGNADIFIIGGGGDGIWLYRKLQRENVPFYCGIIAENDIEFPVALSLAEKVYSVKPFEEVNEEVYVKALEKMLSCSKVYCTVKNFGKYNGYSEKLKEAAEKKGILADE